MLAAVIAFAAPVSAEPIRVMAFGDSLTAGFGLAEEDAFPIQLEAALADNGYDVSVINAGVSGDTTSSGLARLDWALGDNPDFFIMELGANDGLRAIDPAITRDNLDQMLTILTDRDIPTLLTGMYAPPNLGQDYGEAFNAIYPDLAEKHGLPLYPFFLEAVATDPALNQSDGIHPNRQGVAIIVERLLPYVMELIGPPRPAG
ncbi:MAG: arylesterase [Pseudomonadota bacterium]